MTNIYRALERQKRERIRPAAVVAAPRIDAVAPREGRRFAAEMRVLGQKLEVLLAEKRPFTILVCGCGHQEGATTVARELASHFAQENRQVLICGNREELRLGSGVHAEGHDGDVFTTAQPNLFVSDILNRRDKTRARQNAADMKPLIASLSEKFDVMILDSPPPASKQGPLVPVNAADAVLLVVEAARTRKKSLSMTIRLLGDARANVLGVIFNKRRTFIPAFIYRLL